MPASMGGLYLPGVLVRAYPRGGDGLRVCRGPEDLHGVRQVHGRIHAPALHAHAAPARGGGDKEGGRKRWDRTSCQGYTIK